MNEYRLAEALGGVSDGLLQEAAEVKKKNPWGKRLLRIAAAVAAVAILVTAAIGLWPQEENYITGPGLLVVRAFASEDGTVTEENSTILEEGIILPWDYAWDSGFNSHTQGLPLMLSIPEDMYGGMEITFECALSAGSFMQDGFLLSDGSRRENIEEILDDVINGNGYLYWNTAYLGNSFTVNNNQKLFWLPDTMTFDHEKKEFWFSDCFTDAECFADIIIKADEYIVGYAVIHIYADTEYTGSGGSFHRYYAKVLKTVCFPQIDGRYQKVTDSYISEQLIRIHESV